MIKYGLLAFVLGFGFSGAFWELLLSMELADDKKDAVGLSQENAIKKEEDDHENQ